MGGNPKQFPVHGPQTGFGMYLKGFVDSVPSSCSFRPPAPQRPTLPHCIHGSLVRHHDIFIYVGLTLVWLGL